ncbi:hypothetical protein I4U23_010730 [Adineta vaga]|nr:hypothetical protein I4U23_010730 [Adineta vaga]
MLQITMRLKSILYCLCTSASSEYTVALIYPTNFTENHFGERDWQKLVDDDAFIDLVLKEVQTTCKNTGFETPQRIKVVVTEAWT